MLKLANFKSYDFARILNLVVVITGIIGVGLVLSFTSHNNFEQLILRFNLSATSNGGTSSTGPKFVHDRFYDMRSALRRASTEDKTVILTTLNGAWAQPNSMFDLFLESFRIGNNTARLLKHILVLAVDEDAYKRCQAGAFNCYYFKSNYSSEMTHEAKFMTPMYVEMVWEKLVFLHDVLSLGYNFVFTDSDVMWFRDPFTQFLPDVDFQTSCDFYNGKRFDLNNLPNTGFSFVRSNNRTIEFYKYWISARWRYPGLHDQDAFNKIKLDPYVKQLGFTIRFFNTDYFGGFCQPSRDFNKVCTMHANCCVGLDLKLADLRTTLKDWKKYLSALPNQSSTQPFHWRVPKKCHM